jgi:DNA invertase Pin-like site-specific DNA recombinase
MRTALYCRVSTPGQKNTTSLPEQERLTRAHADALGWDVSEPHVFREVEGGEDLYRPQMDRLWDAIAGHDVQAVVVDVLDRLSRDEGDQGAFYHHCDRYGVQIALASEDLDESDHGRNLRTLSGIIARMERVDIRRRTQRGRKARVASGKMFAGSCPLYGYLWKDPEKGRRTAYVIDPETAPIVMRIYEAVAAGVPLRRLALQLEAEGVQTPSQMLAKRGQLPERRALHRIWRHGTILRILHHPAYIGEHCAYRTVSTTQKVRPPETGVTVKVRRRTERDVDDPARVTLPDVSPALVPRELAARAQARLTANKAESAGRNPDPLATIWRGLVVCGHCGVRMRTATSRVSGVRRYFCRSERIGPDGHRLACPAGGVTIRPALLDPSGWADVRAWLSDEENVSRLLAYWEAKATRGEQSLSTRLDAADAQLAVLRGKMATLAETIAETSDRESRRVLQATLDDYSAQVRREESKKARLMQDASEATSYAEQARTVREWAQVVTAEAERFTPAEQRETLTALGAEVTVWREDYRHPDGKPGRYRIALHFTGFTGGVVTLPARILTHTS